MTEDQPAEPSPAPAVEALPIENRSQFILGWGRCMRARYLEYHSGPSGFGIRSLPQALPLATGIHVHGGLAAILTRVKAAIQELGGAAPDLEALRPGFREDIAEASGRYMQAVKKRGFMDLAGDEQFFVLGEQCSLVEGSLWGFIRTQLAHLIDEWELLEIEQEDELIAGCSCGLDGAGEHDLHAARGCDGVVVPQRPDIVLRHKVDGAIANFDFKTASDVDSMDWAAQWNDNPQLALGSYAIEKRYGLPVDSCFIIGIDKGYRAKTKLPEDVGRKKSGPKRQESLWCYAYYRPGNPPFDTPSWEPFWDYVDADGKNRKLQGKGYEKKPIWEAPAEAFPGKPEEWTNIEYWVSWLPEVVVAEKYKVWGPLPNPKHLVPSLLRAIHANGWRWAAALFEIWQEKERLQQSPDEWVEANPELEILLDKLVPQSWECYRYKNWCQFLRVCKKELGWENPLTSGRYEVRRPHHAIELKRMELAGVPVPPEQWEEEE